ncbi:MAG: hypothetical protein JWO19_4123 [Bryobacterales bacterium]|nr:hypothetical protein [Bryobacterales bacterium]
MQNTQSARKLPPLILHPFADASGPLKLVESSRASLMLQGLLPAGQQSAEDLEITLLEGRYQEVRMLFYVGRDVLRWIGQCVEHVNRYPELQGSTFRPQSFAAYLVQNPPAEVASKLKKWGVADHKSIFSRALGLNVILADMPPQEMFSAEFLRHYHRYADQMFHCHLGQTHFADPAHLGFNFEIFASGEYSRMLEREWAEPAQK